MAKLLLIYSVYTFIVLAFSVSLISLGIKGKEESESSQHTGPDYYIGSVVVGTVFALIGIVSTVFIVMAYNNGETTGTICAKACSTLCQLIGFGACIAGLVLVIRFGIQSCNNIDQRSTNCSYNKNINVNYTIAVISMVLILLLFLSLCCSCCVVLIDEDKWKKKDPDTSRHLIVVRSQRPEIAEYETELQTLNVQKREIENQLEKNKRIHELQRRDQQQQNQKRSSRSRVVPIESDSDTELDEMNRNESSRRTQHREADTRETPQSSLPLLKQLQTQVQLIQRNQESQMRLIQSNAQRTGPDFQQPSSSGAIPSAPPYEDRGDLPPSYDSVIYGHKK